MNMRKKRITIDPKCIVYRPGSVVIELPEQLGLDLCDAGLAVDAGPVPGQIEEAESRQPATAQRAVARKSRRRRR